MFFHQAKLDVLDLKLLDNPDVPTEETERRLYPDAFSSDRSRKRSWDTFATPDLDDDTEDDITPRDQLLGLIKLYNSLHSKRDTPGQFSFFAPKKVSRCFGSKSRLAYTEVPFCPGTMHRRVKQVCCTT